MRTPRAALGNIALLVLAGACVTTGDDPADPGGGGGKADDATAVGSALPDPNAEEPPPASWLPPPLEEWPQAYVIFNNTGCGRRCTRDDQSRLRSRSVMAKMIIAAVHGVKEGGVIRVSNFNISSSAGVAPVLGALRWAMQERGATVKVAMDVAQNTEGSASWKLVDDGAQVRFIAGVTDPSDSARVGIEHSKMVIVDDEVILTGSNNFSSSGFITNEENSVVLRAAEHADRIAAFTCDFDRMFEAGVERGQPQRSDEDPLRRAAIEALAACQTDEAWFPPAGAFEDESLAQDALVGAIAGARGTIDLSPDMLANPRLVFAILERARAAKEANEPFRVRAALDASDEALHNPAFAECLSDAATRDGYDLEVRYWHGNAEIFQLLHHKFMLVDQDSSEATLFNGSANFSSKALTLSFENVARYRGDAFPSVLSAFSKRFAHLFETSQTAAELVGETGLTLPRCPLSI